MTAAHQAYLLQARQMQALSFAVHIPLVCFGISFPAMVLFCEWLHLRSGDPLYRTLARRWTRIMAALFAVGVITGTILSFEMGLLWPNFTAKFGGGTVPRPPYWVGYRVAPQEIEFWQERPFRLHDRVAFTRAGPTAPWIKTRLYP